MLAHRFIICVVLMIGGLVVTAHCMAQVAAYSPPTVCRLLLGVLLSQRPSIAIGPRMGRSDVFTF